jgi:glycosyltransferase involved in cell wall biosynthesis
MAEPAAAVPVIAAADRRPAIAFIYEHFGPYMIDRCEAVAARLGNRFRVVGIEIADASATYAWQPAARAEGFTKLTLFTGIAAEAVPAWRCAWRLVRTLRRQRVRHVFIVNYDLGYSLAVALACRGLGIRAFLCMASKFDDKPRTLWREMLKSLYVRPYRGALASGPAHADYARFLGIAPERIEIGYDRVSIERIRRLAGAPPAPAGAAFDERHFTIIARLVAKKNLPLALDAYRRYRDAAAAAGLAPRRLVLCGDGPERAAIAAALATYGGAGIEMPGFLQEDGIARVLATTLALILPSREEQWGLVVNEALAMGVPVLCSDQVGARALLVRPGVNGFVFASDDAEGLAWLMARLAGDRAEWQRMAGAAAAMAPLGDTASFAEGVARLVGA